MTKTTKKSKKYGKPYKDKDQFRRGDIKLISDTTGYAYISVVQQLDGDRKITPAVKAMADKLVENNNGLVDAIKKIKVTQG